MDSEGRPLWLRYPAVSPDGQQIAFCYQGQIWLVPAEGGEAIPLTDANFYSMSPVWSPDGTKIAFASTRHGNADVFVMPVAGGAIQRLTYHSAPDIPMAFTVDGREVIFHSTRLGDPQAIGLDSIKGLAPIGKQVYAISASGGRPRMVLATPATALNWNADGKRFLYEYTPGQLENEWRKHQVSDSARNIWLYDSATGKHTQLTEWRGEDRNPVWNQDGQSMLWLSERNGNNFNVWRRTIEGGEPEQLTRYEKWPVRFLSSAKDGTLVYAWNGEIWRLKPEAAEPAVVPVRIRRGSLMGGDTVVNVNSQVSEFTVSPDGTQVALVARGEVFVTSTADGETRRITTTPAMERNVDFSPDGRRLVYASERSGNWDIIEARLTDKNDKTFVGAAPFEEVVVIGGEDDTYEPLYSPQGDRIAYLHERTAIRIHDLSNGNSIEVQPKDAAYSYYDNDMRFTWAPNGHWLLTQLGFQEEIGLVDASGKAPVQNISLNGFADHHPQVSADGEIAYWLSDRLGLRTAHFSGGLPDVFAAFLTPDALQRFRTNQEKPEGSNESTPPLPKVEGLDFRTIRLTPFSAGISFFQLTPDNKSLIVVFDQPNGTAICYAIDTATHAMRTIFTGPSLPPEAYASDAKATALFVAAGGKLVRYDLKTGQPTPIPFKADMARDAPTEIAALFDHCWRLTSETFYRPDMHGVNWEEVGDHYRRFLPHIIHWEDVSQLLEEMVGELNASHHGDAYRSSSPTDDLTATLGLYYDDAHRGAGMKIAAVIPGGPADRPDSALTPGAIILAVNGERIPPEMGIERLLNRKAGEKVLIEVMPLRGAKSVEERIVAIDFTTENHLAYKRWLESRRELTRKLSNGRIGYVHLPLMNLGSYQNTYGEMFGRYPDAEALIVDVRANGGGNLHDQLITLLTGKHDSSMVSRDGKEVVRNPTARWARPSAVITSANSYSDGSVFPTLYQQKKVGPVIGERTPGTGTAVVRDPLIDPHMTHGVPELGFRLIDGTWFENYEVVPDVLVYNDPESVAEGKDLQLEAAVQVLLKQLARE